MRRRWLVAALALFAAVVLVLPAVADARLRPLFAVMAQPNVPPDHQGGGSFTAVIDDCAPPAGGMCSPPADDRWFCYGIALKDLASPLIVGRYTAHVHKGNPGENGPVVIGLNAPWTVNPGSSSGCIRLHEGLGIPEIPAGAVPPEVVTPYYVDVHSLHSFWAARGQIFARAP